MHLKNDAPIVSKHLNRHDYSSTADATDSITLDSFRML